MRVRGTLTAAEVEQLRKMGRYNLGLTLTNLVMAMLAVTPISFTAGLVHGALQHGNKVPVEAISWVWVVCLTLVGSLVAFIRHWRRKNFERMISEIPQAYIIQPGGIAASSADRVDVFTKWSDLAEWWVRYSVLLITQKDSLDPIVLPLSDLSPAEVGYLRSVLQENWKDEVKVST